MTCSYDDYSNSYLIQANIVHGTKAGQKEAKCGSFLPEYAALQPGK